MSISIDVSQGLAHRTPCQATPVSATSRCLPVSRALDLLLLLSTSLLSHIQGGLPAWAQKAFEFSTFVALDSCHQGGSVTPGSVSTGASYRFTSRV